jgi:hypothetical protein
MMESGSLRRRIRHEDVGGGGGWRFEREEASPLEGLSEPLLGDYEESSRGSDEEDYHWRSREETRSRSREEQAWGRNLSKLLAQWAQWFLVVGNNLVMAMLGRNHNNGAAGDQRSAIYLSPLQEERLEKLQQRLAIPFDGSSSQHQDALRALWRAAFPDRVMPGLVSPQWKDMGWQGNDPATDFRGGGFISLENLLFFAQKFPAQFQKLLLKQQGRRAEWEYPFAVAGLNITFMLIQMLDLRAAKPNSSSVAAFFNVLAADENAFDMLYCVAFQMMDAQWLAMGASYMEFNAVLQATRRHREKEMMLDDVHSVQDLPSYTLMGQPQ